MNKLITNIINQKEFYSFPLSACQEIREALNWFSGHVRDKRLGRVAYSALNRYDSLIADMSDVDDTEMSRIRMYLIGFTVFCEGVLAYYGDVFREIDSRFDELSILESIRKSANPYHDSAFFSKVDDFALMRAIYDYQDRNLGAIMYLIAHSGTCADELESCIIKLQNNRQFASVCDAAAAIAQFACDCPIFWDFVESYPHTFAPMLDTLEGLRLKVGVKSAIGSIDSLIGRWRLTFGLSEKEV